ncbi:unnamed protein product [Protopolystoma xenopodis]|uniref:C3H1-type domain-containing protein n=1 Tax=Protopolystoma xenopodis TaxID=117903 RepID=A0A448X084_9PLAT|nr:unnamed protein product [Protopolystoma xenopodis]
MSLNPELADLVKSLAANLTASVTDHEIDEALISTPLNARSANSSFDFPCDEPQLDNSLLCQQASTSPDGDIAGGCLQHELWEVLEQNYPNIQVRELDAERIRELLEPLRDQLMKRGIFHQPSDGLKIGKEALHSGFLGPGHRPHPQIPSNGGFSRIGIPGPGPALGHLNPMGPRASHPLPHSHPQRPPHPVEVFPDESDLYPSPPLHPPGPHHVFPPQRPSNGRPPFPHSGSYPPQSGYCRPPRPPLPPSGPLHMGYPPHNGPPHRPPGPPLPRRPGPPGGGVVCRFFQQGKCRNGPNCGFLHRPQDTPDWS